MTPLIKTKQFKQFMEQFKNDQYNANQDLREVCYGGYDVLCPSQVRLRPPADVCKDKP
jgi:hypothetical protein